MGSQLLRCMLPSCQLLDTLLLHVHPNPAAVAAGNVEQGFLSCFCGAELSSAAAALPCVVVGVRRQEHWRWVFYSCNGFHEDAPQVQRNDVYISRAATALKNSASQHLGLACLQRLRCKMLSS